ncbi:helicase [Streptomyces cinnamoneus]|uniref:Helicase n=1 Tax=Streptomyces cinnamoneus TaxID=53446 RepID=A0A918TBP7_STRCJ|nr:DEAD/DEAH box helicase [Streptomyces cinnamoneus]GHC33291.1 helicase [Streptomyces cinnamoneus]
MIPPSAATPSDISRSDISLLVRCRAVFLPGDPARTGRVAFWQPTGEAPLTTGAVEELTVAVPDGPDVATTTVRATVLPAREALPVLTRARSARADEAAAFWGAVAVLALQLAARGKLLPGLTATDHDSWRVGPLSPDDQRRVRELAAAMPPAAHAVPLADSDPLLLPDPERLVRAFLDAVADGLPRSPAAVTAAGSAAFAAPAPQRLPEQRSWAADVAAGHDAGVRLSLRVEALLSNGTAEDDGEDARPRFRAVLQLHSLSDPALVADAADVWSGASAAGAALGKGARMNALLALRRAAHAWPALSPLLSAAAPDALELADEEVGELLGAASPALDAAGVEVHWPKELVRKLTARAVVGPPDDDGDAAFDRRSGMPSLLSADALLAFGWRFAIGDQELTKEELDRLAEASRPAVRLRDQWVLVDPEAVRRARERQERKVTPLEALGAALTGHVPAQDDSEETVTVQATGWLAALRDRIADPEATCEPVAQPEALAATLRDYQLRGLDWLHRMTSLGLGGCLADDMGLGKTITLIALHLHRQTLPGAGGPTLVVCPTSLMGNWQREIERFAPGTPVRRFHGAARDLDALEDGEFVLTTYGTMRLDAPRLAQAGWGLVVADEAQHVKNPYSATAKALRTLEAKARIALSGTPVENNLSELWAILDWTTPGLLGSLGDFRRRYAQAVEGGTDPAAAERLSALVRPFLLRRRKSDPGIAPELPPKTETDHSVALTKEQAGLYEAVVREILAEVAEADGFERRGLIVKLLTGLKQICNHPAQFLKELAQKEGAPDGHGVPERGRDSTRGRSPRVAGRSGKVELLDELLDTLLAEGASVLVFTQYVQMARLLEHHLAARGVPTQFLHGGTPVARREEMVRRFQDGEVPVFLLSLKAAGTGLNLTRAGHVVHFDRWWNPAVETQATDRAYRIGQTQPVQVHRLITEGTIEDRIAEMLTRKQALADAVLGSGEAALTELTDAELAELVALRGTVR